MSILDGLDGLEVVGADIGMVTIGEYWFPVLTELVEVAPIYDNPGETTVLAAAEVVQSLLRLMVAQPVKALRA